VGRGGWAHWAETSGVRLLFGSAGAMVLRRPVQVLVVLFLLLEETGGGSMPIPAQRQTLSALLFGMSGTCPRPTLAMCITGVRRRKHQSQIFSPGPIGKIIAFYGLRRDCHSHGIVVMRITLFQFGLSHDSVPDCGM